MINHASILLLAGVLLTGPLGLALAGVAAYNGWAGLLSVWGVGLLAQGLRSGVRWYVRKPPIAGKSWLVTARGVLVAGTTRLLSALLLPALGYLWAALFGALPLAAQWLGCLALVALLGFTVLRHYPKGPRTLQNWRQLGGLLKQKRAVHLLWLLMTPLWPTATTTAAQLVARAATDRGLSAATDSLQWIDRPLKGLKTAFTSARAVVLLAGPNALSDVYAVRVAFAYDGTPTRVTGVFNISETAAVDERELRTWRKWAAWGIFNGTAATSAELADFRGESTTAGPGWSVLRRLQRGLENLQDTGQWRGIERSGLEFEIPVEALGLRMDAAKLTAAATDRQWVLDLGRVPGAETLGAGATFRSAPIPLPGSLVPWTVDRLRAIAWIGNSRMQWLKAWAFRASDQLEELERQVVGIDADETIAEELGDVLSRLPLAKNDGVPGWPPEPLKPMMRVPLAGEGQWVNLAEDIIVPDSPGVATPFVFTFIRTDVAKAYIHTSVALWDPRQLELHIVAGTEEPRSMTGAHGSGTISREPGVMLRVVAAFNGAFQAVHGEYGMMESGKVQLPPKPYGATVTVEADGSAGLGTWPPNTPIPPGVVSLRQNLTPLIVDGKLNPYRRTWWGGVPEGWTDDSRTARTGLCMTTEGFLAYFYSPGITPDALAKAMQATRCTYGVHLDMNAGHSGLELYRVAQAGQLPDLPRPLDPAWEARGAVEDAPGLEFLSRLLIRKMPLMNFPRYIHVVSRDFFYLTRRSLLPGGRLAPLSDTVPDDGIWRTADVDGGGWPFALAATAMHAGDPATRFVVSRIDPKQIRPVPTADAAHFGLRLPRVGGPSQMWLTNRTVSLAVAEPTATAIELTQAAPVAVAAPTSALCIDQQGLLLVIHPEKPHGASAAALRTLLDHMGAKSCVYPESSPVVLLQRSELKETPGDQTTTTWLVREPLRGTKRVFPDTPIVAPADWAFLQQKRVDYAPPAEPTKVEQEGASAPPSSSAASAVSTASEPGRAPRLPAPAATAPH